MATWIRGDTEFDSLDKIDQQRLVLFEWRAISAWNNYFHLRRENLIDEQIWIEMLWVFETIGRRQAVRASWQIWKGAHSPEFQEFMERCLE